MEENFNKFCADLTNLSGKLNFYLDNYDEVKSKEIVHEAFDIIYINTPMYLNTDYEEIITRLIKSWNIKAERANFEKRITLGNILQSNYLPLLISDILKASKQKTHAALFSSLSETGLYAIYGRELPDLF